MDSKLIFNFKKDISGVKIPDQLNNPFGIDIPEIVDIAAREFQGFITSVSPEWVYDFDVRKGKMFGILVVQKVDNDYAYLGTFSGRLARKTVCDNFVPSVFNDSVDDYFMDKGMTELTEMSNTINQSNNQDEISSLTVSRKQKSLALQQRLFENYHFLNVLGQEKSVWQIFKESVHSNPPSAAGECAAPKLLQYAFKYQLKPIALAEFWWGNPSKNKKREHKAFYPACKDKCRPILEYMLDDKDLFNLAHPEQLKEP